MNLGKFTSVFAMPKFPCDWTSLEAWCMANVSNISSAVADDNNLRVVTTVAMTLDQQAAVKTYMGTLTHDGEATKLALPHNLTGQEKVAFENAVKAKIATLTWDSMSVAQRTFSMGGQLSNSDYDILPTS